MVKIQRRNNIIIRNEFMEIKTGNDFIRNRNIRTMALLGIAASVIFLLYSIETLIQTMILGTPPDSIADVFELLNKNHFLGLIRLDILTVIVMPVYFIVFYSISRILKIEYENDDINNLIIIFLIIGFTLFLSTSNIFQMMELSHRYNNEQNEIIKNNLVVIGESLRVSDMWHSTGTVLSGIIIQICAILYSILILNPLSYRQTTFSCSFRFNFWPVPAVL